MPPSSDKAILIVDDSIDEGILLVRAFQKAGITNPVHVVHSGEGAKAYLAGQKQYSDRGKYPVPSIILLDMKMPGIDGFGLLKWIKSDPAFKQIVVIVLTNMGAPGDELRAYQLGANSYLVKPMSMDELIVFASAFQQYWLLREPLRPVSGGSD